MEENYHALMVSVLREVTPERAFQLLDGQFGKYKDYTEQDMRDMIALKKKGVPLKEIAEIFGITNSNAWHRMNRFEKGVAKKWKRIGSE